MQCHKQPHPLFNAIMDVITTKMQMNNKDVITTKLQLQMNNTMLSTQKLHLYSLAALGANSKCVNLPATNWGGGGGGGGGA